MKSIKKEQKLEEKKEYLNNEKKGKIKIDQNIKKKYEEKKKNLNQNKKTNKELIKRDRSGNNLSEEEEEQD